MEKVLLKVRGLANSGANVAAGKGTVNKIGTAVLAV
jgi:hypothetical protein